MQATFSTASAQTMSSMGLNSTEMPSEPTSEGLCCYQNRTGSIQVIRITDLPEQHFERVVFPGQRLMFHAPDWARLEVYAGSPAGALLADTLTCDRMRVSCL